MRNVCAGLALLAVVLTAAPCAIAQNFGTKQLQGKV
jgi:hypothetical protein